MEDNSKYFKNLLPGGKVYMPDGRIVCLNKIPRDSLDLYMEGFKQLALKSGAVEMLKNMCDDDLQYLKELKKGTEDYKIICRAIKDKGLNSPKLPKGKQKK